MSDDLAALKARLAAGPPEDHVADRTVRIPKPIYSLSVDDSDLDERSIILIIRTGKDDIVRGMISLPQWYEIEEMWDGPHDVADAIRLADDYADAYGYYGIAIDIESSQLWQPEWGELTRPDGFD